MKREYVLRLIAESGYNLGYGAKKHFATLDLVEKMPGWLGFVAMAVGIFALFIPPLASNQVSAVMILFGIASMYINGYNSEKESYRAGGDHLTDCFVQLRILYYEVKSLPESTDFAPCIHRHNEIYARAFENSVAKQIFLSDWYAHYKFFWQQQIEWIDEQKHFSLWRDKVPLTVYFVLAGAISLAAYFKFG